MEDERTNSKPILIYFKTRGNAQVIRCVLLQAGVDFQQVFVSSNGYLDPQIIQKYDIDLKSLPYFIYNGLVINGVFPIIKYICSKFNKTQLLGMNLRDSINIAEIMVKYTREKGIILHTFFKGLKEICDKNLGEAGKIALSKKMLKMKEHTKDLDPIREMFRRTGQFLCGYMTVLDFIYYDKSFYACNFHLSSEIQQQYPEHGTLARQYKQFFQSTEFFKKHGEKLSEYKVFFPEVDANINNLIKTMWIGDPKYITCGCNN